MYSSKQCSFLKNHDTFGGELTCTGHCGNTIAQAVRLFEKAKKFNHQFKTFCGIRKYETITVNQFENIGQDSKIFWKKIIKNQFWKDTILYFIQINKLDCWLDWIYLVLISFNCQHIDNNKQQRLSIQWQFKQSIDELLMDHDIRNKVTPLQEKKLILLKKFYDEKDDSVNESKTDENEYKYESKFEFDFRLSSVKNITKNDKNKVAGDGNSDEYNLVSIEDRFDAKIEDNENNITKVETVHEIIPSQYYYYLLSFVAKMIDTQANDAKEYIHQKFETFHKNMILIENELEKLEKKSNENVNPKLKKQFKNDLIKGEKQNQNLLMHFYELHLRRRGFAKDDQDITYVCELVIYYFGKYAVSNILACFQCLKRKTANIKWDELYPDIDIKYLANWGCVDRYKDEIINIENDLLQFWCQWTNWDKSKNRLHQSRKKTKGKRKKVGQLNRQQLKFGLRNQIDESGLTIYEPQMESLMLLLEYPQWFKKQIIYQGIWQSNQCHGMILNQFLYRVIHKLSRKQSFDHCINNIKSILKENKATKRSSLSSNDAIVEDDENLSNSWLCHGLKFEKNSDFESFIKEIPFYPSLVDEKYNDLDEICGFINGIVESKIEQSINEMKRLTTECDKSKCDIYDIGIRYDAILPLIECDQDYNYNQMDFSRLTNKPEQLNGVILINKCNLLKQSWNYEKNKCIDENETKDESVMNKINYLTNVLKIEKNSIDDDNSLNRQLLQFGNNLCNVTHYYDNIGSDRKCYLLKPIVLLPYQQQRVKIQSKKNKNENKNVMLLFCRAISYCNLSSTILKYIAPNE